MKSGDNPKPQEKAERLCRFCHTPLENTFIDLGASPLSNSYLKESDLSRMESFYPLHVYVCSSCFLVQLEEINEPGQIFTDYSYFSSFSDSWLEHARSFATDTIERFKLTGNSNVVEIGSNDGYLLRYFSGAGIPVLGVEPAENVARAALDRGIETDVSFFNSSFADKLVHKNKKADLLIGNNVLAHIPAINDLMTGLKKVLKPDGVISMEFPHLLSLIEEVQFDTIYHEHYSYYSLTSAHKIFSTHGLKIFDLDLLSTHGGSLRLYACHAENDHYPVDLKVEKQLQEEERAGLKDLQTYQDFSKKVKKLKREILKLLIEIKDDGFSVAAYGAPAKGNTLLNYCGIGTDMIDYTVDRSPHKQGLFLPGSRIPIYEPNKIERTKPNFLLILPWNLRDEITEQMAGIRDWKGKFIVLIPEISVF